jgi:hypothetical protein
MKKLYPSTNMASYRIREFGALAIEVLLAASLIVVLIGATIGIYVFSQQSAEQSSDSMTATGYATKAIEVAKVLRDRGFDNLPEGTFGIEYSEGQWDLTEQPTVENGFTSTIAINDINPDKKEIAVSITWTPSEFGSEKELQLTTTLTNWRDEVEYTSFRAIEYFLDTQFTGASYDLPLAHTLSSDYFVLVAGSDGNGGNDGSRGPAEDYIRLDADPFATGDLNTSSGNNIISLVREDVLEPWVGVVTVVECIDDCDSSGFRLLDAKSVSHGDNVDSGSAAISGAFSDISRVVPFGGANGSGCTSNESQGQSHSSCHVRLWPTGTDTIEWSRSGTTAAKNMATSTVMVVEWGSDWSVERVFVSGNNGGDGVNLTTHYNTTAVTPFTRANSWVWGTGWAAGSGPGDSAEGSVITIGDGVEKLDTESYVAVGQEHTTDREFDVYILSHSELAVDHQFKADGDASLSTKDLSIESNDDIEKRMTLGYFSSSDTGGGTHPRSLWSTRYLNDDTVRIERRRTNSAWAGWIQGISFKDIGQ